MQQPLQREHVVGVGRLISPCPPHSTHLMTPLPQQRWHLPCSLSNASMANTTWCLTASASTARSTSVFCTTEKCSASVCQQLSSCTSEGLGPCRIRRYFPHECELARGPVPQTAAYMPQERASRAHLQAAQRLLQHRFDAPVHGGPRRTPTARRSQGTAPPRRGAHAACAERGGAAAHRSGGAAQAGSRQAGRQAAHCESMKKQKAVVCGCALWASASLLAAAQLQRRGFRGPGAACGCARARERGLISHRNSPAQLDCRTAWDCCTFVRRPAARSECALHTTRLSARAVPLRRRDCIQPRRASERRCPLSERAQAHAAGVRGCLAPRAARGASLRCAARASCGGSLGGSGDEVQGTRAWSRSSRTARATAVASELVAAEVSKDCDALEEGASAGGAVVGHSGATSKRDVGFERAVAAGRLVRRARRGAFEPTADCTLGRQRIFRVSFSGPRPSALPAGSEVKL